MYIWSSKPFLARGFASNLSNGCADVFIHQSHFSWLFLQSSEKNLEYFGFFSVVYLGYIKRWIIVDSYVHVIQLVFFSFVKKARKVAIVLIIRTMEIKSTGSRLNAKQWTGRKKTREKFSKREIVGHLPSHKKKTKKNPPKNNQDFIISEKCIIDRGLIWSFVLMTWRYCGHKCKSIIKSNQ